MASRERKIDNKKSYTEVKTRRAIWKNNNNNKGVRKQVMAKTRGRRPESMELKGTKKEKKRNRERPTKKGKQRRKNNNERRQRR